MFKTMGHETISVLDGGLPNWESKGFPVEPRQLYNGPTGTFEASFVSQNVKDHQFIANNLHNRRALVIDGRTTNRFLGLEPEPRKCLRTGHIPGALNVPFPEVLSNGKYKSKQELAYTFSSIVSTDQPLVFYCGSGVTACIVLLASELVLNNTKTVYDGSWAEWGSNSLNPIG